MTPTRPIAPAEVAQGMGCPELVPLRLGSLFSGFGGLDLAIEHVFGARTAWVSDIEPGPCKVLAYRFPHAPNLGDITAVDWPGVEPVDIIAGGSPCQDISSAGRMAGMREGTRSNLWVEMREAIRILRPRYVVWENVGAARSTAAASAMESDPGLLGDHPAGVPVLRALGRVLGDLASLGYDAQWYSLRAADVGAPHGRLRFFILAADADHAGRVEHGGAVAVPPEQSAAERGGGDAGLTLLPTPRATRGGGSTETVELLPTPRAADSTGVRGQTPNRTPEANAKAGLTLTDVGLLLPTPSVADSMGGHERRGGKRGDELLLKGIATHEAWWPYAAAIARWEAIHGPAPSPTKPGRNGRPKLNPAFAEWMMGAPPGWITDTPGVTDNEALRMAGNGVVQQQAVAALRLLMARMAAWGEQAAA